VNFVALFLVSLATVGYETALTRYFAVAKWSEYGYWVISIVMVGFALSGVVLALWRDAFAKRSAILMAALPAALVLTAAIGYHFTTTNPFNPLQLQNPATWQPQIWNIAGYYAALLPFFFLAGLFISLSFVRYADRIGRVYAFDLTGAGAGSASVLAAMYVVHAFGLVPLLLIPLAVAAFFIDGVHRWKAVLAALLALGAAEALVLFNDAAAYNDFKAIYAPLHTPDAKIVASVNAPRGNYALLDDFTERVDTDISNNAGMLGVDGPPRSYGLYRDGNRIAALPSHQPIQSAYAAAALDALPYQLIPHARVMLAGASGGFRTAEALRLGASQIRVLEPEPELFRIMRDGLDPVLPLGSLPNVHIVGSGPLADAGRGVYDVVDLSADFLDAAETNATAFTREAIVSYLHVLAPNGIVSIPVSIRDFPVYALRMLSTVRAALLADGIDDPAAHVIVYRSAWNVRILIARDTWTPDRIAVARKFCDDRSFDMSWYPGLDVAKARADIYNDLPAVSFDKGEVESDGPDDAIADEAQAVLSGQPSPSREQFNLAPITLDRPFFYAVLRLDRIGTILKRLEILPQAEVGALVNLAVLAQAIVIAALVLLVPLAAPGRIRSPQAGVLRAVVYFPALALGFLFVEIYLIEKASFWLGDRTNGFALVLTGMLVFSGLGSVVSERFGARPRQGMAIVTTVVLVWCAVMLLFLQPLILATLDWPFLARSGLLLLLIAPVSVAMGLPFPLGLNRAGTGGFLPWAWGLNGAFSVVATPLANLIARESGFSRVLFCAAILYGIALVTFPAMRKSSVWHDIPAPSPAAE
jgi:MFS family permease/Na+-translocating ferredoxin:NAD+ oxidoreductase RnfA subunit